MRSLYTMPYDDLMSFSADRALLPLFLKLDYVPLLSWNKTLASPQPYFHDFESSMAFTSTTCRILISGGFFAFSTSLSASSISLQPYLPCLLTCQIGFQQFIPSLPPLPSNQPDLEFVQKLVKEYQTPYYSIGTISLSKVQSFPSW